MAPLKAGVLAIGLVLLHAHLVSSAPEDGQRLGAPPNHVRLTFSEPVDAELARAVVVDEAGEERRVELRSDSTDVRTLLGAPPHLASGSYRLAWRIVSADGHPVAGSFVFHVGVAADEVAEPPAATGLPSIGQGGATGGATGTIPPVATALRGLGMGALLGLTGLLVFLSWGPGTDPVEATSSRLATGLAVAAPLLLAGHLVAWSLHVAPPGAGASAALSEALASGAGQREGVRAAGAALVAWALLLARRPKLAAGLALVATAAAGATGHAVSDAGWSVPFKAFHLLAVALWLGGLLTLAAASAGLPNPAHLERARAVSRVALAAVAVVVATGVLQAWRLLPDPVAALASGYGLALAAKVGGTLVLVVYGARHRFRLLPRLEDGSGGRPGAATGAAAVFRRSVRQEVGVMVVVLLVAGLLAYLPLPAPPP